MDLLKVIFHLHEYLETDDSFDISIFLKQFFPIFLLDDLYFHFIHRLLHIRFFYKHIHCIHHRARSPNIMDYLYVHPLEWIFGGLGIFIGIILFRPSIYTTFVITILRNLHESYLHCGYDFKFLPSIPLICSARYHDNHHSRVVGNYSNATYIWDYVFGTRIDERYII